MDHTTCRDGGESTPLIDVSTSSRNRDGRVSYCRPCLAARHRRYRDAREGGEPTKRRPARASSAEVTWCPQCRCEQPRAAFGQNRSSREYWLQRRHGITPADDDALAAEQGGVCALCRRRPPQHVDHEHHTGQVRGLLCSGCNQGLGNVRDDAAVLRLACDHVAQHAWQKVLDAPGAYRMVPPRSATQP